jgi:hypothetical protein
MAPAKKKPKQRGTKESQEATVARATAFVEAEPAPPKAAPPVVTQQTCPRCNMRFRTVTR